MPHLHKHITTRQNGSSCCPPERYNCCQPQYLAERVLEYICYSEWLPNVRILVPHVPDNILLDYIRRGAITFARQSQILQRRLTIELQDCVADYYPCLGKEERIATIQQFCLHGSTYKATNNGCQIGSHRYWFHPPNTLEIYPAPKRCHELTLIVDAVPTEESTQVDRIIYDRHFPAVENYAVAQAILIPREEDNLPSHKAATEQYALRMENFRQEVSRAKIDLVRHYSTEGQNWITDCD